MLIPIADPTTWPVSIPQLRAQLRLDTEDFDLDLTDYRAGAVALIEAETTRILSPRTLEYRVDAWPYCYPGFPWSAAWPNEIVLPVAPVRDVREISYLDADAVLQVLPDSDWYFDRTEDGAIVRFVSGWSAPTVASQRKGAVRIQFDAGYDAPEGGTGTGDDPAFRLPDQVAPCVRFLVAHWFRNREPVSVGASVAELPLGAQALINQLRIYR